MPSTRALRLALICLLPLVWMLTAAGCLEPPGPEGYVIQAAFTHSWNDIDPVSGTIDYEYDSENPDSDRDDMIECRRSMQPARYSFDLEGEGGSGAEATGWSIYIDLHGDTEEMYSMSAGMLKIMSPVLDCCIVCPLTRRLMANPCGSPMSA